jgi:parvulin-like peptidyl-prolyl isomerase
MKTAPGLLVNRLWAVFVLAVLISGTAFLMQPARAASEKDENRIVAIVNNEVITQAELNRALIPAYFQLQATLAPEELSKEMEKLKKSILGQIIDEHIMLQMARDPQPVEVSKGKIGTPPVIEVSDSDVQEMVDDAKGRFEKPDEFYEVLKQQGITEADLKSRFRDQIMIQRLIGREIRSRITVSPTEVTEYYESHKEEFVTPEAVQVATILIRPKDNADYGRAYSQAQDLYKELGKGADFYETARKYSDGFNAQMGGRIGFVERGKTRKEIEQVLFSLTAGKISPVIKTPAGFQIFLVEAVRPAQQATLAEAQTDIQSHLYQKKTMARYQDWIARLRADAYITIK